MWMEAACPLRYGRERQRSTRFAGSCGSAAAALCGSTAVAGGAVQQSHVDLDVSEASRYGMRLCRRGADNGDSSDHCLLDRVKRV